MDFDMMDSGQQHNHFVNTTHQQASQVSNNNESEGGNQLDPNSDVVTVEDFGAKGDYLKQDGSINLNYTNDTQAFKKAVEYATSHNKTLKLNHKNYYVDNIVFPEGNYDFSEGRLVVGKGANGSDFYNVKATSGAVIDKLDILVTAQFGSGRLLSLNGAVDVGDVKLKCTEKIDTSNDLFDAMVNISGENGKVGSIRTQNSDNHVMAFNARNWNIGEIKADTYIRGMYMRQCRDMYIGKYVATNRHPNAKWHAGDNGLLIEGCQNLHFRDTVVEDAGEHAIRLGGTRNSVYKQGNHTFDNITTRRSGGSGFKVFSGELDGTPEMVSHIKIGTLNVLDSRYKLPTLDNRDALHLEYCSDVDIDALKVNNESEDVSTSNGMYLSGVHRLNVENAEINHTSDHIAKMVNTQGKVNDIRLNHLTARDNKNGVLIDQRGETLRDIYLHNLDIEGYGDEHYAVVLFANTVRQPVVFDETVRRNDEPKGAFYTNSKSDLIENNINEI
ncbi:hypothetical protein K0017_05480 [Staphylococcus massiliensis]|uniref:hypothetical protein n=1 Tax=Staphylococcus massiliensis TaxID=555791 RepID=UPI001EE03A4D|nr:hypothetical protein [Staphylococcus massiliensis]